MQYKTHKIARTIDKKFIMLYNKNMQDYPQIFNLIKTGTSAKPIKKNSL